MTCRPGISPFGDESDDSCIPIRIHRHYRKKRVDESECLTLNGIRQTLIRQEDSIIFSLLKRTEYCYYGDAYDQDAFSMDGFHGSPWWSLWSEKLKNYMPRWADMKVPMSTLFFPRLLPDPIIPRLQYPKVLHPCSALINLNNKVLSRRIHYGKFVAEAKYLESPASYEAAIKAQDRAQLMKLLTYEAVEAAVRKRVEIKTKTYGLVVAIDPESRSADPVYKINPSIVADLNEDWIMPLTKEVQVEYLLRRLD